MDEKGKGIESVQKKKSLIHDFEEKEQAGQKFGPHE